jgi:hypothetical protein
MENKARILNFHVGNFICGELDYYVGYRIEEYPVKILGSVV